MSNLDQFESAFRSAAKASFHYKMVPIKSVLVVTDLDPEQGDNLSNDVRKFLSILGDDLEWDTVLGSAFKNVAELLKIIETRRPDLVITYRHLHSDAWHWPFSLGVYLDVLTQATTTPVMVVPHPDRDMKMAHALKNTDSVVAITDHLTADDELVNWAVRFTAPGGVLHLTHVEDEVSFKRTMEVISKIPEIDTTTARKEILQQLLKEPHDYIQRCRNALAEAKVNIRVEATIELGHHLELHKKLVEEQKADLLVMNTKDDDQFAMRGLAHALAVEMRGIPLLML